MVLDVNVKSVPAALPELILTVWAVPWDGRASPAAADGDAPVPVTRAATIIGKATIRERDLYQRAALRTDTGLDLGLLGMSLLGRYAQRCRHGPLALSTKAEQLPAQGRVARPLCTLGEGSTIQRG